MFTLSGTLRERFEAKVDRSGGPDACHPWTGSTNGRGYGQIFAGWREDGAQRNLGTHVVAALLAGMDPLGRTVRHTCDNPPCCNGRHIVAGTQAENLADCRAKGRHNIGARNGRARLDDATVREIRARVAAGETQTSVAAAYGVSRGAVGFIVSRQRWAHVADAA